MNNCINIPCNELPFITETSLELAVKPFVHCDRTADFNVLIYLKSGFMEIIEGETTYTLTPNTLFFLKAGEHHYGKIPCAEGTSWCYAHFYCSKPSAEALPYSNALDNSGKLCLNCNEQSKFYTLPKLIKLPSDNDIESRFQKLAELFNSGKTLQANVLLADILIEVADLKSENYCKNQTDVELVLKYIDKSFYLDFSSGDIEKVANFSYKYIGTAFKEKIGMTIKEYQLYKRIQLAEKLLCTTDMTINEIAAQTGFYDQFYLSRYFKQKMGMSPLQFRKRYIPKI